MRAPSDLASRRESACGADVLELWELARRRLKQRRPDAVFLEGSIAEGFGNPRSDVDFVAVVDDGTELPTMPYILFAGGRRVEVRYLSSAKLRRQLGELREAVERGPERISKLSWDLLDRCQRFMGSIPLEGAELLSGLKQELGEETLRRAVHGWFEDFARQAARYAVALHAIGQPLHAAAWLRTAVQHAAKNYCARRGETYVGLKWLSVQLERAGVSADLTRRFWSFYSARPTSGALDAHVRAGVDLVQELEVAGVSFSPERVVVAPRRGVTSWQIGERLHVVRKKQVFALGREAQVVWRRLAWDKRLLDVLGQAATAEEQLRHGARLAEFERSGLIGFAWSGDGRIKARRLSSPPPISATPVVSAFGAHRHGASELELLPLPAKRFAEAGMELTWANVGLENAREDALGALERQQFGVLQFSLERMAQMACLIALAAHGVTPAVPLEEATLEARRALGLSEEVVAAIDGLEATLIEDRAGAERQFELATRVATALRHFAGDPEFPASFGSDAAWRDTILVGYDWINLITYLDARFPMTAPGGRGSLEEARDVLASGV